MSAAVAWVFLGVCSATTGEWTHSTATDLPNCLDEPPLDVRSRMALGLNLRASPMRRTGDRYNLGAVIGRVPHGATVRVLRFHRVGATARNYFVWGEVRP